MPLAGDTERGSGREGEREGGGEEGERKGGGGGEREGQGRGESEKEGERGGGSELYSVGMCLTRKWSTIASNLVGTLS